MPDLTAADLAELRRLWDAYRASPERGDIIYAWAEWMQATCRHAPALLAAAEAGLRLAAVEQDMATVDEEIAGYKEALQQTNQERIAAEMRLEAVEAERGSAQTKASAYAQMAADANATLGGIERDERLRDAASRVVAERDRLAEALRIVEWGGTLVEAACHWPACPSCRQSKDVGHAEGCHLAAALRRAETALGGTLEKGERG